MTYIYVYNWETKEMKEFAFEWTYEAEDFASRYELGEDEELCISDGTICMEYSDYLCMCFN